MANLIPFAADVLGGVFNSLGIQSANESNKDIAKMNNEYAYKMFHEQMDYNTRERLAAQQYNSPANQRRMYEQAGINPYAMVGNMSPESVAQTSPAAPTPQMPNIIPDQSFGKMMSDIGRDVGTALENEQIGLTNEDKRIELRFKVSEKLLGIQDKIAELRAKGVHTDLEAEQYHLLQKQSQMLQEDLDILQATKPEIMKQRQLDTRSKELDNRAKELSNAYTEWQNEYAKKHGLKELALMDAQIKESLSQSALNGALSAKAMAEKALTDVEKQGVQLDVDEKKRLRGHVLKMARLAEEQAELTKELTKYQTGVNGRDVLNAVFQTINGIGTAALGYYVGKGGSTYHTTTPRPNPYSVNRNPYLTTW